MELRNPKSPNAVSLGTFCEILMSVVLAKASITLDHRNFAMHIATTTSHDHVEREYHWDHNYYSQFSYFSALIRITVTVIIFPGIN